MTIGAQPFDESRARIVRPSTVVFLSWLAMIGVGLFLHAGVLAPLYDWDSPFLPPSDQAFMRIPVGYAALLGLALALVWLLSRLGVRRGREGAVLAGGAGAVVWSTVALGLWSISTAVPALLVAWWAGQTAAMALAGYVIGSYLSGASVRKLTTLVVAVIVLGVASAVIFQSVGYAPTVRI